MPQPSPIECDRATALHQQLTADAAEETLRGVRAGEDFMRRQGLVTRPDHPPLWRRLLVRLRRPA